MLLIILSYILICLTYITPQKLTAWVHINFENSKKCDALNNFRCFVTTGTDCMCHNKKSFKTLYFLVSLLTFAHLVVDCFGRMHVSNTLSLLSLNNRNIFFRETIFQEKINYT